MTLHGDKKWSLGMSWDLFIAATVRTLNIIERPFLPWRLTSREEQEDQHAYPYSV